MADVLVDYYLRFHECVETISVQIWRHTTDLVFFALLSINFVEVFCFLFNVPALQVIDDRNVVNEAAVV